MRIVHKTPIYGEISSRQGAWKPSKKGARGEIDAKNGQERPGFPMNYKAFFADALNRLHEERRYRVFADLERIAGRFPHALWHTPRGPREVVIWCSNDYLALGQHPKAMGAMVETATR